MVQRLLLQQGLQGLLVQDLLVQGLQGLQRLQRLLVLWVLLLKPF
jgi:hypothetical protein